MTAEEFKGKRNMIPVQDRVNSIDYMVTHNLFTEKEMIYFAEAYHQEKMKQHDALVKIMAQDEKEGNYQDKCCDSPTIFYNVGLDDLCVRCGKNITPSPPSNL